MNNIDVSKVSLYSEFPPLVDYQDAIIQFTLPSHNHVVPAFTPNFAETLYDQTHSVILDKAFGIADIRVSYDGMVALETLTPTYSDSIGWSFRSTLFDFQSDGTGVLPSSTFLVGGKNVSGKSLAPTTADLTPNFFALNFLVWFTGGIMYCRATLHHGNNLQRSYSNTAIWAGGNVEVRAKVSLLPY